VPQAQGAFKVSMVHILQFTLRIAFRCVVHRYGSQDIRSTLGGTLIARSAYQKRPTDP